MHILCVISESSWNTFAFCLCSEASMYAKKDLHTRKHLPDKKPAPFRPDSCCCIPLCLKLSLMCYQRSKTWIWVFQGSALITSGMGVASPCAVSSASLTKHLLAPAPKSERWWKGQYRSFANTSMLSRDHSSSVPSRLSEPGIPCKQTLGFITIT